MTVVRKMRTTRMTLMMKRRLMRLLPIVPLAPLVPLVALFVAARAPYTPLFALPFPLLPPLLLLCPPSSLEEEDEGSLLRNKLPKAQQLKVRRSMKRRLKSSMSGSLPGRRQGLTRMDGGGILLLCGRLHQSLSWRVVLL